MILASTLIPILVMWTIDVFLLNDKAHWFEYLFTTGIINGMIWFQFIFLMKNTKDNEDKKKHN